MAWLGKLFGKGGAAGEAKAVPPAPVKAKPAGGTVPARPPVAPAEAVAGKPWQAGNIALGEYRVERELGHGGMGAVYLLRHAASGKCFAVKRALLPDEVHRRLFLGELQTWIDLPEHPHIAPYRFFRTLGNELLIFTDFFEGGSLRDRLGTAALSRVEDILDMAIQFAWGLHALHELGLVHQDVKPGNALLTAEGLLKVSDFGLTGARKQGGLLPVAGKASRTVLATHAGAYTPPYCSPEQAMGQTLTRRTDVWSWGLSVLAMFCGGLEWKDGVLAAQALAACEGRKDRVENVPSLPHAVAAVLRRCFELRPEDRWPSVLEAGEVLALVAYRSLTGQAYPRPLPGFPGARERLQFDHDRRVEGAQWADPRPFLATALRIEGRDQAAAEALAAARGGSRAAQAVGDLAVYDEAYRLFHRLVQSGRSELSKIFALLCMNKALVHRYLNDPPGVVAMYENSVAILQRLVEEEGRRELAENLARALMNWAVVIQPMGMLTEAVALFERSVAILQRLVEQEGRRELTNDLASALMNQANALLRMRKLAEAAALYERSVAILQRLVEQEGRRELTNDLASALMNQAIALQSMDRLAEAVALFERSVAIRQRLVEQEGRRELSADLALALMNQANALLRMRKLAEAASLYERSVALYQRLVEQEGRRELSADLAKALMNQANALQSMARLAEALALHQRSVAIYQRLVEQEGRRELSGDLAKALTSQANAIKTAGRAPLAAALYEESAAIYQRLVVQEGRRELAVELAWALMHQAEALMQMGRLPEAAGLSERSVALYQRLVEQEGRRELARDLAKFLMDQGSALHLMGKVTEAVALYGRSVALYQRLVEQEGRRDLAEVWVRVVVSRAIALKQLGKTDQARADARWAIATLEQEGARTGRTDQQLLEFARENFLE